MSRLLPALALVLLAGPAHAQLAIGGQLGDPTGLSLKFGAGPGALALAVGWDLDDSVSAEGHYLLSVRRVQGADVDLFYGPGAFVQSGDDDTNLGVSLGVGLETSLTREIELYGLVSPRLRLVEDTDFDLGGGVGVRLRL